MEKDIHVLAVDDSFLDRKVVERLLKNSSYKVTTVDSAERALEVLGIVKAAAPSVVLNAFNINLIITDYCMPEMTGYDLLKRVKESSALKEIPVVIMSSENVPSRINMCLAEGAEEFIIKPLRVADVKRLRGFIYQQQQPQLQQSDSLNAKRRACGPGFEASISAKRQAIFARHSSQDRMPDTKQSQGTADRMASEAAAASAPAAGTTTKLEVEQQESSVGKREQESQVLLQQKSGTTAPPSSSSCEGIVKLLEESSSFVFSCKDEKLEKGKELTGTLQPQTYCSIADNSLDVFTISELQELSEICNE